MRSLDSFTTITGYQADAFGLRPEDVRIDDIAISLSHICRFGGHVRFHYSVAQHCVYACDHVIEYETEGLAEPVVRLHALLHDAAEAYIGDQVSPNKWRMAAMTQEGVVSLRRAEDLAWHAIAHAVFGPLGLREGDTKAYPLAVK